MLRPSAGRSPREDPARPFRSGVRARWTSPGNPPDRCAGRASARRVRRQTLVSARSWSSGVSSSTAKASGGITRSVARISSGSFAVWSNWWPSSSGVRPKMSPIGIVVRLAAGLLAQLLEFLGHARGQHDLAESPQRRADEGLLLVEHAADCQLLGDTARDERLRGVLALHLRRMGTRNLLGAA